MSIKESLKIILGDNQHNDYSHEELIKSLEGKYDEFTKYRTNKEINKRKDKIIKELTEDLKYGRVGYDPKEQYYLDGIIQIYRKLPFEYKLILYGQAEGILKCLE